MTQMYIFLPGVYSDKRSSCLFRYMRILECSGLKSFWSKWFMNTLLHFCAILVVPPPCYMGWLRKIVLYFVTKERVGVGQYWWNCWCLGNVHRLVTEPRYTYIWLQPFENKLFLLPIMIMIIIPTTGITAPTMFTTTVGLWSSARGGYDEQKMRLMQNWYVSPCLCVDGSNWTCARVFWHCNFDCYKNVQILQAFHFGMARVFIHWGTIGLPHYLMKSWSREIQV